MKVIAYDAGTTGLKTCLFEISKEDSVRFLTGEVGTYALNVLENGGIEQNPEEWWSVICKTTRQLLANTGTAPQEIKGISFCSQMQTVV